MATDERHFSIAHASDGRLRLRLPWLKEARDQAEGLADGVRALEGLYRVEVRPSTGSVLCLYDPEVLSVGQILARVQSLLHAHLESEHPHEPSDEARVANSEGSRLARAASRFFKVLDADLLDWSDGTVGLPGVLAGSMLAAGAWQVLSSGELELPAWHDLVWRAVRILSTFEEEAITQTPHPFEEH